ncbi:MAG: ATP-binding cassette domain-containing protein, partial [Flavisolibacter sp.]
MLRAENISYAIGNKTLLEPTTLSFDEGSFHVIMGSNGAGKSTLVKLFAGDIKPKAGIIYLNDIDLQQIPKVELARRRAVLSQHYAINFPINVNDIVLMGRYPYYSNNPTSNDIGICEMSKQLMEVSEFGDRDYNTLSGGEAQKVQMSRVLAQIWEAGKDSKILFLDEPTSGLDPLSRNNLWEYIQQVRKDNKTTIFLT